jgi:hypothetical protein
VPAAVLLPGESTSGAIVPGAIGEAQALYADELVIENPSAVAEAEVELLRLDQGMYNVGEQLGGPEGKFLKERAIVESGTISISPGGQITRRGSGLIVGTAIENVGTVPVRFRVRSLPRP